MNDNPVLSSLRIKKLFGKHDLSIDFKKLTVIVGKNGVGKTTLLKIIHALITERDEPNYRDICESIALNFNDGNAICYGIISDELIKSPTYFELPDSLTVNDKVSLRDMVSTIKQLENATEDDKIEVAKNILAKILKTDVFINASSKVYMDKFKKNQDQVFKNSWHTTKIKNETNIRYISTVNISANAGNKMDLGNSIERNILDLAIHEELRLLLKNGSDGVVAAFKTQLDIFLQESGKKIKRDHGEWKFITDTGHSLRLEQLSSGERQLVYILATAANTCGKPTLFLMDEPEVSLHLSWQEKIIDAIMNIHPQIQIIAVTHSPGIIMNGHMDAYVEMKDIMQVSGNV